MNEQRTEELTAEIALAIKKNYMRGPISRDRAFEALNALAAATSIVILGCDEDPAAKAFFLNALEQNIEYNRQHIPYR